MAALHPLQCLLSTGEHLVVASGTKLSLFNSAGELLSTSSNHTSLIRLLVAYTEGDKTYLISTGEDKHLHVSQLPSLELLSSRELVKRANALSVTSDGVIVVGDKFGDVYSYPLHAPAPPTEPLPKGEEGPKAVPLLGHVSMLNTLCLVPADTAAGLPRDLIVTGDRDEHVRVSRFPKGHIIEQFLWGSKKFISALTYLPPTSASPTPLLLAAGGDPTIQVFDLATGKLQSSFPVEEALEPYVTVGPELPTPVPAGRKKNKADKRKLEKGKAKAAAGEDAVEAEEGTPVEAEGQAEAEGDAEEEKGTERDPLGWKDGITTGLAVIKMMVVGSREEGGLIVLASGATALLYIPFSLLLGSDSTACTSVLDLSYPTLDITPVTDSSTSDFYVSLDLARGSSPSTDAESPVFPLRRVSLASHVLSIPSDDPTSSRISTAAALTTDKLPNVASLYPVLSLLHHPDQSFEDGTDDRQLDSDAPAGKGRGKGRKELKRAAEGSPAREGGFPKTGKRAAGRAEIKRRLEEQRLKAEGATATEGGIEGEKMEVDASATTET